MPPKPKRGTKLVASSGSPAPLAHVVLSAFREGEPHSWNLTWDPPRRDPSARGALLAQICARRDEWPTIHLHDAHVAAIGDDVELLGRALPSFDPATWVRLGMISGVEVQGWSLLEIAAGAGSVHVVDALLTGGGALGALGKAPRYAAQADRAGVVERLLAHGADPIGMLARALGMKRLATVELLIPRCNFVGEIAARHAEVLGALSSDVPPPLLDRMIAAGLDLNAWDPDREDSTLAHRIGESSERRAEWLAALLERGYELTAQRIAYMLQGLDDDARDQAVPLLDVALARAVDLDGEIQARSDEEDDPPTTLFDLALEQFPLAVAKRLADAGARPTQRALRKSWPEAKAKAAWLASVAGGAGFATKATRQLRDALGDAPARKKALTLERWDGHRGSLFDEQPDLTGIEACTQLTRLGANQLGLVDIAALAQLPKLKSLELMGNAIDDVSPLAALAKLELLNLARNRVTDVSALASLAKLKTLYLAHNPVEDIAPLAACTSLVYLSLRGTRVGDLSPIAKLPDLETLVLADCEALDRASETIIEALRRREVEVITA